MNITYNLPEFRQLIIEQDSGSIYDPRNEMDNLGEIIYGHRRYNIGDKKLPNDYEFTSWKDTAVDYFGTDGVWLPVYMMDHSGLSLSTTSFNCPWDPGQLGIIGVSREKIKKEFTNSPSDLRIKVLLLSEVNTYDQYLRGEVYMFSVSKKEQCNLGHFHEEVLESVGGFYGSDIRKNGILDHLHRDDVEFLLATYPELNPKEPLSVSQE